MNGTEAPVHAFTLQRFTPFLLTSRLSSLRSAGIHRTRRALEERPLRRGLGKRDHVTQRFGAREQHHDAVHAEGEAAMRRRAGAQPLEQESEALLGLLLGDPEQREDPALEPRIRDTQTAAAELGAVQYHVVGQGAHLSPAPCPADARSSGCGAVNG